MKKNIIRLSAVLAVPFTCQPLAFAREVRTTNYGLTGIVRRNQMRLSTALLWANLILMACASAQAQVYGKDDKKYVAIRPDLVALGANKVSSDEKTIKIEVRFGNAGKKGAGSFKVMAYCEWEPKEPKDPSGGTTFGGNVVYLGRSVQSLDVNETKIYVSQCTKPSWKVTRVIFRIFVDSENQVKELSELNNKYSTAFSP